MSACWTVVALCLASVLGSPRPACAIDLRADFANLRNRQYFLRIGIGDCSEEESVVRVVCDSDFILHDLDGKELYSGKANTPLRFNSHSAKSAEKVYYYILDTFGLKDREKAETLARRATESLNETAIVREDPRAIKGPSPVGTPEPMPTPLAVVLGPFSWAKAKATQNSVSKYFEPTFFKTREAPSPGLIEVHDAQGNLVAQAPAYVGLRPMKVDALTRARPLSASYKDWATPGAWLTPENRAYRDPIEVWINPDGRMSTVNRVFIEHYLYSVVQTEIGNSVPFEMLKTQAVASRSEAIAKLSSPRYSGWPYDYTDSQMCQAYKGALIETAETNAAVDATWGQVCTYGNEVIDAVYSENSGGLTANNEDVWGGTPLPYLRSRYGALDSDADPNLSAEDRAREWLDSCPPVFSNPSQADFPDQCRKSDFRWTKSYDEDALTRRVRAIHGSRIGKVTDVRVARRTPSGRVWRLEVETSGCGTLSIEGETPIRNTLDLRSTFFALSRSRDSDGQIKSLTIQGAGWGHGVGLCQVGGTVMAQKGHTYAEILKHYFTNISIYRIYR